MTFQIEFDRAKAAAQEHIFAFFDTLNNKEQEEFLSQVSTINYDEIQQLFADATKKRKYDFSTMTPPVVENCFDETEENKIIKAKARESIQKGELALFTVAGGQGSRLGFNGPKGCFPITPIKKKTIFEVIARKILAANKKYNTTFEWYIMTSQANDSQTKDFFKEQNYFGLSPDTIVFFAQDMLPAVDTNGKLLLSSKSKVFTSPNGTGGIYDALVNNGITKRMKEKGIKYLSYFHIDNPLVVCVDEGFLGYHLNNNANFSSKVVSKAGWDEKVGVLAIQDGKTQVVEYSQMTESQAKQTNPDGSLTFVAGNIGLQIMNREFIEYVVKNGVGAYASAFKKVPHINNEGELITPEIPNAYKFERFVFDVLPLATNNVVFEVKREEEFAPTKNKTGIDSAESATQLQIDLAKSWMKSASFSQEFIDSLNKVEVDPLFALTREDFIEKTKDNIAEYEQSQEKELYFS